MSQFESAFWQRYLLHFDSVLVCAREGSASGEKHVALYPAGRTDVAFQLFPSLSSLAGQVGLRGKMLRRFETLAADADVVLARLPSELGLLACHAARRLRKPLVVEVAGCPWDALWNYGSWKARLYAPVLYARTRRAVRSADFVHYVTREFLQRRYPHHARLAVGISNVELGPLQPEILERRREKIRARGDGLLRFGLIGTLDGRFKGIHVALAALARSRHRLPPFEFRILGAGDATPWRALSGKLGLETQVVFDGTLASGGPVRAWLDALDIYLQPSLKEGLPRALIEAMSRACPALASSAAGMPELLQGRFLARPGDVPGLAECIVHLATSREEQLAAAERNFREAENYAADRLEPRRCAFWAAVVDAARDGGDS